MWNPELSDSIQDKNGYTLKDIEYTSLHRSVHVQCTVTSQEEVWTEKGTCQGK